jgi:hypothetical protein
LTRDGFKKLALTIESFSHLARELNLPPAFISAVCQSFQPCGTGFRILTTGEPSSWDYWTLIPFRVRAKCQNDECGAGMHQMNPHNYIHLKDVKEDVRGSHIAIHIQRDGKSSSTTILAVFFLDGRFGHLVQTPISRVDLALLARGHRAKTENGLFVLLIYLDVILEWWNDVLYLFNNQLIREVAYSTSPFAQNVDHKGLGRESPRRIGKCMARHTRIHSIER